MTKRLLPPMGALKAFESAARLGSMIDAADELHVTQSAISKQIRTLEDWLGEKLFERLHREIKLTPKGQLYFQRISRPFMELDEATRQTRSRQEKATVRFCGYQTLNMRWLIPRLTDFHARYPDIQVEISASMESVDFRRNHVDCAIRTSTDGDFPGCESTYFAPIEFRPVARPLRPGDPPLDTISDLTRHVLIVSETRAEMWPRWLSSAGAGLLEPNGWLVFDHGSFCYQAALEGAGVALGETVMVESDIAAGRLFYPFLQKHRDELSYYFIYPTGGRRSGVREFAEWLVRHRPCDSTLG